MKSIIVYVHGKNGSASEAEHYRPLFPDGEVVGFDYRADTPWEFRDEFRRFFSSLPPDLPVFLIANSIGAYYVMNAGIDDRIGKAWFVSPVVDLEKLIRGRMALAGVTEERLRKQGVVPTESGEDLSWEYLSYVRSHPIRWNVPTAILYGAKDALISRETVSAFADAHCAELTVMEAGEHWFHTPEQMAFLDRWIAGNGKSES
ncbi:MAG: alpha/beta hydrolase [Eubacteriales bacterium]|nr:alpha/beta hydrolase [Eubacteriales bacterium]